jgi:hypothetical protein
VLRFILEFGVEVEAVLGSRSSSEQGAEIQVDVSTEFQEEDFEPLVIELNHGSPL